MKPHIILYKGTCSGFIVSNWQKLPQRLDIYNDNELYRLIVQLDKWWHKETIYLDKDDD